MIAHLLLGQRGPQDILGELLSPRLVLAANAHLMMDAKAGVPPAQEFLDVEASLRSCAERVARVNIAEEE